MTDGDASLRLVGAVSAGYFGACGGIPGDLDGDGQVDLVVAGESAGAVFLGPLSGDVDVSTANATFERAGDGYGAPRLVVGLDGDGVTDLVLASPQDGEGGERAGAVFVLAGSSMTGAMDLWADSLATIASDSAGAWVGLAVSAGDLDGDGVPDLVVGASGAAYAYLGPVAGVLDASTDGDVEISSTTMSIGGVVSLGDVDADGYLDLLTVSTTAALLFEGPLGPGARLGDGDVVATVAADRPGDATVRSDLDGDGYADLLIGSPSYSRTSEASLYYGPLAGTYTADAAAMTMYSSGYYDAFGAAIGAGDLDGDGIDDAVISNPDVGGGGESLYLLLGGG